MNAKKNIMIFGTSEGSNQVLEIIDLKKVNIVCYLDNDKSKQGKVFMEKKIMSPNIVAEINFDFIVLGSMCFYKEMTMQLVKIGVERKKIITLLNKKKNEPVRLIKELYYNNSCFRSIIKDKYLEYFYNNYAICTMAPTNDYQRNIKLYNYPDYIVGGIDYVRISTLELLSKEILEKNIDGSIAELGVYKGDFAKALNSFFSSRKLYLFDTFEGFSSDDVEIDQENGYSKSHAGHLGDTSIEVLLQKLEYKNNIVIKKGYFPNTTNDIDDEEKFAFVSLDVDLYKPTLEGLKYFYENLSKGGYIMIHDYGHPEYKGVRIAVREFCESKNINCIPVSDHFGSVIIAK